MMSCFDSSDEGEDGYDGICDFSDGFGSGFDSDDSGVMGMWILSRATPIYTFGRRSVITAATSTNPDIHVKMGNGTTNRTNTRCSEPGATGSVSAATNVSTAGSIEAGTISTSTHWSTSRSTKAGKPTTDSAGSETSSRTLYQ
jgi:hypothetical protein